MSLVDTLRKDMFVAKRDGDTPKSNILSMAIASIVNAKINKGEELTEEEQIEILRKEAKKLKDAFDQFTQGGREDLASNEKVQLAIIETYLPQLMSEEDIKKIVSEKISELGVDLVDTGKLMGLIMPSLKGKADGALVSKIVRELTTK